MNPISVPFTHFSHVIHIHLSHDSHFCPSQDQSSRSHPQEDRRRYRLGHEGLRRPTRPLRRRPRDQGRSRCAKNIDFVLRKFWVWDDSDLLPLWDAGEEQDCEKISDSGG